MGKKIKPKKKFGYTGPKKTYIVDPEKGVIPIEEWPNPGFGIIKKPTLHAKGGLVKKGKPKLTKKGWK
jgi:hypothetical protein